MFARNRVRGSLVVVVNGTIAGALNTLLGRETIWLFFSLDSLHFLI